jgi:hypothetical protein
MEQRIEESNFHADYRTAEERYRQAAGRLIEREMQLRERIRSCVDAAPEERLDSYMEGRPLIEVEYDTLTTEFSRAQSQAVVEAERRLYKRAAARSITPRCSRVPPTHPTRSCPNSRGWHRRAALPTSSRPSP